MFNKTIIIIDDVPEITETFKMILELDFKNVLDFNNPREGLDFIMNNDVDFIVCDLKMPELNGIELFKQYRMKDNKTPFVFYSGHAQYDPQIEKLEKKYRLDGVYSKPNFNILDKIKEHFNKN